MEVTFEEARAHPGIETQRQWNDLAIARSTPILFGLFLLSTDRLITDQMSPGGSAAWYEKARPTFSDAIATVRRCMRGDCHFSTSGSNRHVLKVPARISGELN